MSTRLSTLVAGGLVGVLILSVVSIAALAGFDRSVPGVLENLAAGALGALAALLARVGSDVQAVEVINPPTNPVPVEGDTGHADVPYLVVIGAVAVIVVTIYHLIVHT